MTTATNQKFDSFEYQNEQPRQDVVCARSRNTYTVSSHESFSNIRRFMMSAKVSDKDFGFIESVSNFKDNLLDLKSLELAEEDSLSSS